MARWPQTSKSTIRASWTDFRAAIPFSVKNGEGVRPKRVFTIAGIYSLSLKLGFEAQSGCRGN